MLILAAVVLFVVGMLAVASYYLFVRRHKKEIVERVLRRKGIEESRCQEPAEMQDAVAQFEEELKGRLLKGRDQVSL